MRIRMLGQVMTGGVVYEKGDEADMAEKHARPLVDSGAAKVVKDVPEKVEDSPAKKPKGKP